MSEKEMFAEMFGETAEKPKEEAKPVETPAEPQKDERQEETPAETPAEEPKEEKSEEDDGVDQKLIDDAKKELGIGGAAFCDELLAGTPEAFSRLKAAGKTLHGFFNFAYSYAMDEYVKANGRVNGGGYWNLSALLEKYLDPSVKEGFTVQEPKAKKIVPPKPTESPTKTVEKIAKKAAKAAKAEKPKKVEMKIVEPPKPEPRKPERTREKPELPKVSVNPKNLFAGIDLSKLV